MSPYDQINRNFESLFGMFGMEYSLSTHVAVALGGVMIVSLLALAIARLRGETELGLYCAREVVKGFACIPLIFLAPYGLYLIGRAFWLSMTGK